MTNYFEFETSRTTHELEISQDGTVEVTRSWRDRSADNEVQVGDGAGVKSADGDWFIGEVNDVDTDEPGYDQKIFIVLT